MAAKRQYLQGPLGGQRRRTTHLSINIAKSHGLYSLSTQQIKYLPPNYKFKSMLSPVKNWILVNLYIYFAIIALKHITQEKKLKRKFFCMWA